MKGKIFLNQIGYYKAGYKTACFVGKAPSQFVILNEKSDIVFKCTFSQSVQDISSKEIVNIMDFSSFCQEGTYIIKAGSLKSEPFLIKDGLYDDFFYAALKYYYYSRCGIDLEPEYAGQYSHKKCHTDRATLVSDDSVTRNVTGGWHDAGDFGRYTVTATSALGHILYSYYFFKNKYNIKINIPNQDENIPDILSECLYELNWLLKMQDKDGGVFHKVSTKKYPSNVMPEDDIEQLFLFDKTTSSTADFCAVMALASRIYEEFNEELAQKFKTASLNAWAWILNNPSIKPAGNIDRFFNVEYQDRNIDDDIFWAACELYSLTGEETFHNKITNTFYKVDTTAFTWLSVGGFGAISYIFSDKEKDVMVLDTFKTAFTFRADNIVSMVKQSGYGTAISGSKYLWGSNMQLLTKAIVLCIANFLIPKEEYEFYIQEQLNYILGKNPLGKCYVTGFGTAPVLNPHHRQSSADFIDEPIPGMVVGGPDMLRSDECSRWMIPMDTPPSKCYFDESHCYCCNEPAIFFNSAAVFVLAAIKNQYEGKDKR